MNHKSSSDSRRGFRGAETRRQFNELMDELMTTMVATADRLIKDHNTLDIDVAAVSAGVTALRPDLIEKFAAVIDITEQEVRAEIEWKTASELNGMKAWLNRRFGHDHYSVEEIGDLYYEPPTDYGE